MMLRRLGRFRLIILAALLAATGLGISLFYRVNRTLTESAAAVRDASHIPFHYGPVQMAAPAGLEILPAAASFRDVALYRGGLWVLSRGALEEYSLEGEWKRRFATGIDLPGAPLVALETASLADTHQEVLFVATEGEGLLSFDGSTFRQMRPERLEQRKVRAMLPLETGDVLLGTERAGILRWDGKTLTVYHPLLAGLNVTALAGNLEELWIGTIDRGVLRFHAGQLEEFGATPKGPLPDAQVLSLVAGDGRAFAGTALGVASFRDGRFERILAEGSFASALDAGAGRLWIGTIEEGIFAVSLEGERPRSIYRPTIDVSGVRRIRRIGDRRVAATAGGVYFEEENRARWSRIEPAAGDMLRDRNVAALAVDESGRLWTGYFDRGLDIRGEGSVVHVENDMVYCVNRILPQPTGAWIATANGLVQSDAMGRVLHTWTQKEGLIASHITDLAMVDGGLALATPAGLTLLNATGPQSLYAFHGLVNNHVYSLAAGHGKLLAGTLGGISVLERGVVQASYTTSNSALRHNWISALATVGDEWFAGTYGAGVFRFDGLTWSGFPDLPADFEVNPNAMLVTEDRVYAGTLDRGLAVYSRRRGRWNFVTVGLPSKNVTALASAGGVLYIGTDNGIARAGQGVF